MASKRRLRRKEESRKQRSCEKKKRYIDEKQAKIALGFVIRKNVSSRPKYLHAYECDFCKKWHLGHFGKIRFEKVK